MRILLADDHEVVRNGVRSLLADRGYDICGEAVNGQDAVEKAKQLKPDVVVMDISMPNLNGLEATRLVRRILPDTEVVILSQHNSTEMVRQAFSAGARGYVVKSQAAAHLLTAIETVSRHENFISGQRDTIANIDAYEILQRTRTLERELHDSEERFRSAFEQAAVGIAHVAADGRWLLVNQTFSDIVGYTPAELVRLSVQGLTHKDDLAAETEENNKLLDGASDCYSIEKRYIRKNRLPVWVRHTVSAVRDDTRQLKYILAVVEDISARKEYEQASYRLAAIVESSDDAIISKDLNGIITSWNRSAERLFGYAAAEAIGQHINLIIPSSRRDEEVRILERLRRGERVDHFETVRRAKDGKLLDISLTISPVKDAKGRFVGASKVARDISERKQVEATLKEAELAGRLLQLQDEERARIARELHDGVGQLLAGISMNIAKVAAEKSKLSLAAARCVDENSSMIEQVSDEIRTVSHLLHPPLLDEVGLHSAIQWYVDGFAERSKVNVTLELPADDSRLPQEYELTLFRVVQECLTNVHRHSASLTAVVRLLVSPGQVSLEVRDQGKGIDREVLSKIASGLGAGVGLRGMRERAKRAHGSLTVRANGTGTSVVVSLPLPQPTVPLPPAETRHTEDVRE